MIKKTEKECASITARMAGLRTPIIIGGQIDDQVCRDVGADYSITDAMEAVRLCRMLTGG